MLFLEANISLLSPDTRRLSAHGAGREPDCSPGGRQELVAKVASVIPHLGFEAWACLWVQRTQANLSQSCFLTCEVTMVTQNSHCSERTCVPVLAWSLP